MLSDRWLSRNVGRSPRALLSLSAASLLFASCVSSDPANDAPLPTAPSAAKGGSGGGGTTADVVVNSVTPDHAPQDTTLTVAIFGSGFGTGARAIWSLNGDTTQVIVKSTKVVSSTQLNATIEVTRDATVAAYSIIVVLPGGKKGVGAEKFSVDDRNPTPDFNFDADATLGIRPDSYSTQYRMGVCGVNTRIFAFRESQSGDAIMDTDNPRYSDRKCRSYPRSLVIDYGDGVTGTASVLNLNRLANNLISIPIGATEKRGLNVGDVRCNGLRYKTTLQDGTIVAGDSVLVTRTSHTTFIVETQPAPNNRAYCLATGASFNISAKFAIVSDKPMP